MATRFVNLDRQTPMLLPPSLQEWIAKDDIVRFVIEAVEHCDLSSAKVNTRGTGHQQYPPGMMLSLLIFCYANRIFSSRQIEQATHSHVSLRYLCANLHPDHDTIAAFRRDNGTLLERCFVSVLCYARETKAFGRLGTVSVDGTKLAARASQRSNRKTEQLEEDITTLQGEIAALLQEAEQAEALEARESSSLREGLQDKTTRQAALKAAKAKLEARQRASHEQRLRQARGEELAEPSEGASEPSTAPGTAATPEASASPDHSAEVTSPVATKPVASKGQGKAKPIPKRDAQQKINLVEPESRVMRDAHGNYLQGYNLQAAVAAGEDRCQLVVGIRVTNEGNDRRTLAGNLESIPAAFREELDHLLADKGYDNADANQALEKKYGITILCPPQNEAPPTVQDQRPNPVRERRQAFAQTMRERFADPAHQQLYRRRSASVEPVFGVFKNVLGFRRFRLFGLVKAGIETTLLAIAYNVRQIARRVVRQTAAALAAAAASTVQPA